MARIVRVDALMVDLVPKVRRTDAIQSFVSQETPIVTISDSDGATGTGYSYTIGTGGPSVMKLIERTLGPALIGRRCRRDRAHLARPHVPDPRDDRRRDHGAGAGRHRHGLVGSALPQGGAAAAHHGGRRAGIFAALHDRRRLAAPRAVGPGRGRVARQGRRLRRREDQDRPAARIGGHGAPSPPCATPAARRSKS